MSRPVVLVLGDQLFDGLPGLPADAPVLMAETRQLATHVRHHQQKLVLFFSAMRHFTASCGREFYYFELSEKRHIDHLVSLGATEVWTFEIADSPFRKSLMADLNEHGIKLKEVPNPSFLTPVSDWNSYAEGRRTLKMAEFYRRQRIRLKIMVEGNDPVGGQWSFDHDNRKSVPASLHPPPVGWIEPDEITKGVIDMVAREFADHPGDATSFCYPVTHAQAEAWLERFLLDRFASFGPYEDAIHTDELVLWHSLLSPLMNLGLVTPEQVVHRALEVAERERIPIASLEGFVRQVIGWREFIRGIDREYQSRATPMVSPFGNRRHLGDAWWTGTTGLPPLDGAIRRCIDHGWCHHIERLMVIGSAMLMSEVSPDEAHQWFMDMFIDSADWVMGPNVYGMSQFADGGLFATKPYFSGSAYLVKMSNYPKGEWCDVWDGLYWRFIQNNRAMLAKNPRLSALISGVERLEPTRRDRIFGAAEAFIDRVTLAPKEIHS